MDPQLTRKNHYVSEALLKHWSSDGERIHAYRLLVSNAEVPEWDPKLINGLGHQHDLYTTFSGGRELDEFEHWIEREFETPGLPVIEKLLRRQQVTPEEWGRVVRLVAAQDVRTPLNYIESMKRWSETFPALVNKSLEDTVRRLESSQEPSAAVSDSSAHPFNRFISVRAVQPEDGEQFGQIETSVTIGRAFWLTANRRVLTDATRKLLAHRWSVAESHGDAEWPLSDHPVLRLNFFSEIEYDFGGGWDRKGCEVLMPISPRHILYTQVGHRHPSRFAFSEGQTRTIQRLLVERAHRWIFATRPLPWVTSLRPRVVDREQFERESRAWKEWHPNQLSGEIELDLSRPAAAS